jgi:RNA polymerase sigma-70 factor (ECF subfamily)
MEKTDAELAALCLSGDESAFPVIVSRHLKPVYNFVFKLLGSPDETDDVTQEVFFKAWKNLKKYQPDKKFRTWLFSIAKNASIDYLRKKRSVPLSEFDDKTGGNMILESLIDPLPTQTEMLETLENLQALETAISGLSVNERAVLFLKYNEELTFEEIGQILEKPMDTVKSQHLRGLKHLREILRE